MKYTFILNRSAGVRRDAAVYESAVRCAFAGSGHDIEVTPTERPGHGHELARRAVSRGVDAVVAIGGDGTLNEIARALVGTPTALGLIPKGSGNGFAREFGIPLTPGDAARVLRGSRPLAIDAGRVNGDWFFNIAGFGLDAEIARAFDRHGAGGRRGRWPYVALGVREYLRHRPAPVTLRHDDGLWTVAPLLVALANGTQYGSGARIAPDALITDGRIDVVVVENAPWPRLLPSLPRVFQGTFRRLDFLRTVRTKSLRVEFDQDRPYHVDGEIRTARRLDVDVAPGALRFLAPPNYAVRTNKDPDGNGSLGARAIAAQR